MKRLIVAVMLVASVMLLGACGNTDSSEDAKAPDVDVNQQVETEDKDALSEETENLSGTDISSIADAPVITIDLPEDIPVADEDGEIPGADGEADFSPEIVTFGRFYQDADGNELTPIEWMVLDEKDGYSLLLTRQIIASKGWVNEGRDDITWEETDLRQWLDNDFYNTAFTAEEQGAIATFDTTQLPNPRYDTPAGNSTLDKVSLLSYQELVTYMPTDAIRQTTPTAYAIAQGCYLNPEGDSAWWLRSPGPTPTIPEHLASWGNLGARTHYIDDNTIGVRPVIWVKTSSLTAE